MKNIEYRDAMIIINRLKGVTTVPPNSEELREACRLAIEAMRKQIPRKPKEAEGFPINLKDVVDVWKCPECEKEILGDTERYCYNCGQALDWEED